MRFLEKLSEFVGKYMAIIVVIIAAIALFQPSALIWIKTSWVTTLLMIRRHRAVPAVGAYLDKDELGHYASYDSHVRYGAYDEAGGLRRRL